jgi:hypothetical protein
MTVFVIGQACNISYIYKVATRAWFATAAFYEPIV